MKNSWDQESRRRLMSSSRISEDRISELPDSLIQHIISLLDAKDAVKTCVLSKRWEFLWTSTPNLLFYCGYSEEVQQFASFIDKTLMKHTSSKIKIFSLDLYDYYTQSQVHSWLQFAIDRKVEELCLQLELACYNEFEWPKFMYKNSSVTKMSLTLHLDEKLEGFCWKSLKVLSFNDLFVSNDAIRSILVGSPLLECLTLRRSATYDNVCIIDASCSSLKELVIDDYNIDRWGVRIDITAPNLSSLTTVGCKGIIEFNLLDVSSLVEANMDFYMGWRTYDPEKKRLKHLVGVLSHVKKLTIGIWCIQNYLIKKAIRARIQTATRKILEIDMESTQGYLLGLLALLYSLPSLEQLTINLMPAGYDEFNREDYYHFFDNGAVIPVTKPVVIRHLKNIKITGYAAGSCSSSDIVLIEMVQYLLANTKVLQKLIIYAKGCSLTTAESKIAQRLMSYPRASRDAVVLFESHLQCF